VSEEGEVKGRDGGRKRERDGGREGWWLVGGEGEGRDG
jgi:hypothetical protein